MYRHIIWDFDGTLFDTYPVMSGVFHRMLAEEGITEPLDEILKRMKVSMSYALEHYEQKYQLSQDFFQKYKKQRKDAEIDFCRPYEGISEICGYIYASGRSNYLYTHRGDSAIMFLKKYKLYDYFSDFITSQHGFERKPSPQAIQHLTEKHQIKKEEALMIGDRELDILAAKNAGIHACFFSEGNEQSGVADFTIHRFEQLSSLL